MQLLEWRNQDFVRNMMFTRDIIDKDNHMRFLNSLEDESYLVAEDGCENKSQGSGKINMDGLGKHIANKQKYAYIGFVDEIPFGVLHFQFCRDTGILDFGHYLVDEKYLNSGLGTVLEYVVLNFAFDKVNAIKVLSKVLAYNKKVIGLHSKFGFVLDMIKKDYVKIDEDYYDVHFQSMDRMRWEQNKAKIERAIKVLFKLEEIEGLCYDQ
jgi:RimJ/RimL family protein N-acetyltransferase